MRASGPRARVGAATAPASGRSPGRPGQPVVAALKSTGIWQNALVTLSADNGGPIYRNGAAGANNFPLRGGKKCACLRAPGAPLISALHTPTHPHTPHALSAPPTTTHTQPTLRAACA